MVGQLRQVGHRVGDETDAAGREMVCQPAWNCLHAGGQSEELAVPGACGPRFAYGSPDSPLLACPEATGTEFHGEEFRAGGRHAQAGRISRPNTGGKRLHQSLEGFAAKASQREVFERFILGGHGPRPDEPFTEEPQTPQRREHRRGQDAADSAGGKQPETAGNGLRAAAVKHKGPPNPRIDTDQFVGQAQPVDQPDRLGASREKAIGGSFDQPTITAVRLDNPSKTAGGLDQRHSTPISGRGVIATGQQGFSGR